MKQHRDIVLLINRLIAQREKLGSLANRKPNLITGNYINFYPNKQTISKLLKVAYWASFIKIEGKYVTAAIHCPPKATGCSDVIEFFSGVSIDSPAELAKIANGVHNDGAILFENDALGRLIAKGVVLLPTLKQMDMSRNIGIVSPPGTTIWIISPGHIEFREDPWHLVIQNGKIDRRIPLTSEKIVKEWFDIINKELSSSISEQENQNDPHERTIQPVIEMILAEVSEQRHGGMI